MIINESILRKIIRESLKHAINEAYSFNGYFDAEIDLFDCFGLYVDIPEFYVVDDIPVRVYYHYTPFSRSGDRDIPDTQEDYEYKKCEPTQDIWQKLVTLSGLDEEEMLRILDSYVQNNMEELIRRYAE